MVDCVKNLVALSARGANEAVMAGSQNAKAAVMLAGLQLLRQREVRKGIFRPPRTAERRRATMRSKS